MRAARCQSEGSRRFFEKRNYRFFHSASAVGVSNTGKYMLATKSLLSYVLVVDCSWIRVREWNVCICGM